MDWQNGRRSDNIEDRRGMSLGRGVVGGGIGTVVIAVIAMFLGVDPRVVLQGAGELAPQAAEQRAPVRSDPAEERMKDFVSVVLADTEDTWGAIRATASDYALRADPTYGTAHPRHSSAGWNPVRRWPVRCPLLDPSVRWGDGMSNAQSRGSGGQRRSAMRRCPP
jgi:predicted metalloprotease